MTIDVNDWPLDPYTVDGVELATRLNKVIPSEFNALSTGKANLSGNNTFTGSQTFNGTSLRFWADFTSAPTACYTFQSATTNGATHITAMPNGTSTTSSFRAMNAPSGNASTIYIAALSTECQLVSGTAGSGTSLPLVVYCGGLARLAINATDGQAVFRNEGSGYCGKLAISNQANTIRRAFRVNTANNVLEILNVNETVVTHSIDNSGGMACNNGGFITKTTAGGNGQIIASKDGANNQFVQIQELISSASVLLGYYPGLYAMWGPNADTGLNLGASFARWATIYASNPVINTSDAREKTPVRPFTTAEIDCAMALANELGVYQWLTEINEKGADAKLCIGMTAQRVVEFFTAHGLDATDYKIVQHDAWPAIPPTYKDIEVPVLDDDGNATIDEATGAPVYETIQEIDNPGRPAGDRYNMSYTDALFFIARGVAENLKRIEARIAALEARP